MEHCISKQTRWTNINLPSAHSNFHKDTTDRLKNTDPCTVNCGQNGALMQLIQLLNKAAEAVKWLKQMDRAVMLDQLTHLVVSCNPGTKLSHVLQRTMKRQTQLIHFQRWRSSKRSEDMWGGTCKWTSDWKKQKHLLNWEVFLRVKVLHSSPKTPENICQDVCFKCHLL